MDRFPVNGHLKFSNLTLYCSLGAILLSNFFLWEMIGQFERIDTLILRYLCSDSIALAGRNKSHGTAESNRWSQVDGCWCRARDQVRWKWSTSCRLQPFPSPNYLQLHSIIALDSAAQRYNTATASNSQPIDHKIHLSINSITIKHPLPFDSIKL